MKSYWMGEDIETLPRETLIEIIQTLGRDLDRQRDVTRSVIDINNMARAARARR